MKFKDIPQLPKAVYNVFVPLRDLEYNLERYNQRQIKFGYKFHLNPDFQRGHVWTEEQQIKFVEYLLSGGEVGINIIFNHSRWQTDYEADMVCLDGLQRLTACLRFLRNEIKVFGLYCSEFEDEIPSYIGLEFQMMTLNRKDLLQAYIDFNSGGTTHRLEEINRVRKLLNEI